ncbi:MAG: AEC family transporter [Candidatus Kapaibacterium sp.]
MDNIILILVLLLLGIGLKFIPAFPENTAQVLTSFVIYVSLPALILIQIPKLPISHEILVPALMPWAMLAFSALLVIACSRLFGWSREVTGVLMLLVPLGNTSFFGIPMIESFFGKEMVSYAILYDQFGTFLALATYGSVIVALYAGGEKATLKSILKKIVTFPPLIALTLAFALYSSPALPAIDFILTPLAGTLVPLVIIAVGLKVEFRVESDHLVPMGVGLGIKLCIAPLLALGIVHLLNLKSPAADVSIFEAGMPPQISAWALAMSVGLLPKLGAMMVGVGIILSFLTLTLLFQLL